MAHNALLSAGQEGGILVQQHLLKDTASGAPQHPLQTYKGTSHTAEGDASDQALQQLKVCVLFALL